MRTFLIGLLFFSVVRAQDHQLVQLFEPRGTYTLDFDKIYETVASLDIETAVTLPEGFTFSLDRPGSIDFINAFVMQNTLFFTRTIDHRIATSIICNVLTPSGETRNLVFKIRGGAAEPAVYAIHFVQSEGSSREIESLKAHYAAQMTTALAKKETDLNQSVHRSTLANAVPAFFRCHRRDLKMEYKGAAVYVDGLIFSRNDAYIYLQTNIRKDNCDIIKLLGIKEKANTLPAELVDVHENIDGTWSYIYKTALQPGSRKTRVRLIFEIWSKKFGLSTTIS